MKAQQTLYILITITAINNNTLLSGSSLVVRQATSLAQQAAPAAATWSSPSGRNTAPTTAPSQPIIKITPEQMHLNMTEFQQGQGQVQAQAPSLVESIAGALVLNYATSVLRDFAYDQAFSMYKWWHGKPTPKTNIPKKKTEKRDKQQKQEALEQPQAKQPTHPIETATPTRPIPKGMLKSALIKNRPSRSLPPYVQRMIDPRLTQRFEQELPTLQQPRDAQPEFIRPEDVEILPPAPGDDIVIPDQVQPSMQQPSSRQELIPVQQEFADTTILDAVSSLQHAKAQVPQQIYQPLLPRPTAKTPLPSAEIEIGLGNPLEIITPHDTTSPKMPSGKTPEQEPQRQQPSAKNNQNSGGGPKGSTSRGQRNFAVGLVTGITGNALSSSVNNVSNTTQETTQPAQPIDQPTATSDTSGWSSYLPSFNWRDYVPSLVSNLLPIAAQQFLSSNKPHPVTAETVIPPLAKTVEPQKPLTKEITPSSIAPTKIRSSHRPSSYERSLKPSKHYPEQIQPSQTITRATEPTHESRELPLQSNQNRPAQHPNYTEPLWYPSSHDNYGNQMAPEHYTEPMYGTETPSDFLNNFDQGYVGQGAHMGNNQKPETKEPIKPIQTHVSQDMPKFIQRDVHISTEDQPAFHRIKNRSIKQHTASPAQPTEHIKATPSFWTTKTIIGMITLAALTIVAAVFLF